MGALDALIGKNTPIPDTICQQKTAAADKEKFCKQTYFEI